MTDSQRNVTVVVAYVAFLGVVAYSHSRFLKALADKKAAEPTWDEQLEHMHKRAQETTDRLRD